MPTLSRLLPFALLLISGAVAAQTKPCPTNCSIEGSYSAGSAYFLLNSFNPTTTPFNSVQLTCPDAVLFKWTPAAPGIVAVSGATASITLQPGQSTTQTITALGAEGCVLGSRRVVFSRSAEEVKLPADTTTADTTAAPPIRRAPTKILMVPNPSAGPLSFYTSNPQTLDVTVYNVLGQRLLSREVNTEGISGLLDLTDLPPGFYRVHVVDEGGFVQDFKLLLQYH